jgi:acetyltransferase-like isoleucine patch superfamily enzyme
MLKQLLLSILPSFISVWLRRLGGAKIGKNVRIKFGTIILSEDLTLGDHVSIGPFTLIQGEKVVIKDYAIVGYLVSLRAKFISLGYAANILPNNRISGTQNKSSKFILGDHSMILPFCYMDPGEGITIGNKTGVGGYSLLFTHGSWPDHLNGGPVSFGPIVIEDNVWLPWRVFVLPNVTIGSNSVIGGNSLINKTIPAGSLAAGSPAKVIKETAYTIPPEKERMERLNKIIEDFYENAAGTTSEALNFIIYVDATSNLKPSNLLFILHDNFDKEQIAKWQRDGINVIDHKNSTYYRAKDHIMADRFKGFISKYGIRLYVSDVD